jgi:hypothetical protein
MRREDEVALNGIALVSMDEQGQSHVDTPGSLVGAAAAPAT